MELSLFRVEKRVDHFGAFVKDLLALNKIFFLWDLSMADNALTGDLMLMRVICTGGIRMIANGTAYVFEEETAAEIRGGFEREVIKPVWAGKTSAGEAVRKQKSFFFRRMMEKGIPYEIYLFPRDEDDEDDEALYEEDAGEENSHFHPHGEGLCRQCGEKHESIVSNLFKGSRPYVRPDPKTGRNDPCPCGSCKKYKKCCGYSE